MQRRKDIVLNNAKNVSFANERGQARLTKIDAEGNLLSKNLRLHHKMLEHITTPAPIRMRRFDQITLRAASATTKKFKYKKKSNVSRRMYWCV